MQGRINHVKTEMLVDCGASMTIISEELANVLRNVHWERPELKATAVTGHNVSFSATGKLTVHLGKQSYMHKVHVQTNCPCNAILGVDNSKCA